MTTEDALLAAVLAAPDDDLPRLVLADWLDENGREERAHIIRDPKPYTFSNEWGDWALVVGEGETVARAYVEHFVALNEWGVSSWPQGVRITVRRGFVSEVRCTLAGWCGRSNFAEVTSVSGFSLPPVEFRTTGIGPQIVRRHPVTKVVLTDREPHEGVSKFLMWSQGISERPHAIPLPVWNLLSAYAVGSSTITRFYPTREAAISALSAALVAWAKSQPHPASIHTSPVSVDVTYPEVDFTPLFPS